MSQNYGYGGRQNPYDQRSDSPARGGAPYPTGGYDSYGAPPPQQQYNRPQQYGGAQQYGGGAPTMGRDEYSTQNVEMEPLAPNGQPQGRVNNSNNILSECRDVDNAIVALEDGNIRYLKDLQASALHDASGSGASQQLDGVSAEIMTTYRNLADRVKKIKSRPESGSNINAAQVGRLHRKLRQSLEDYQKIEMQFRAKSQEQMARQYRIVRQDATPEEVKAAVNDSSGQQIFSQALMKNSKTAQATTALTAVRSRHEEIQKIERQMVEIAELFQDMENLVVQQEAAVTNIEMKGEEVVENMDKGTEQIGTAVKSARNARKWKWWCLGIVVLIIIIIVVVVLLYKFVFGPGAGNNNKKRFVLPPTLTTESLVIPGKPYDADSKLDVPGLEWNTHNGLVRKTKRFEA